MSEPREATTPAALQFDKLAIPPHAILESSTGYSIAGFDRDETIAVCSGGARPDRGSTAHEVVSKTFALIPHDSEDVASGEPTAIMDEASTRRQWEGNPRSEDKDGHRFTARMTATPLRTPVGEQLGAPIIPRDLTTNEQLEQQPCTRGLIEPTIGTLTATGTLGMLTLVSRHMCEVAGHTREELIGSRFGDHVTDAKRAEDRVTKDSPHERSPHGGMTRSITEIAISTGGANRTGEEQSCGSARTRLRGSADGSMRCLPRPTNPARRNTNHKRAQTGSRP